MTEQTNRLPHKTTMKESNMTANTNLPATTMSGTNGRFFDSDDSEGFSPSLIVGTKIKFSNTAEWVANDEAIPPDRKFIVADTVRAMQKWTTGCRRPESRILGPDEPFPNVRGLNAAAPKEECREAFGQWRGPYENVFVVYLCDLDTLEGFSYLTSTVGGFQAVKELKACGRRAQLMRGPNMHPVVTLSHAYMRTAFGGRERPHFRVCGYLPLGPSDPGISVSNTPLLARSGGEVATPPKEANNGSSAKNTEAKPDPDLSDKLPF
jgi:hypothetical protein